MKAQTTLVGILLITLLAGCRPKDESLGDQAADAAQKVKQQMGEAVDATQDTAAEAREKTVSGFKHQLAEMDQKIDELTRQANNATGAAKEQAQQAVSRLRKARDAASDQLDKLAEANEATWQNLKDGFDAAWKKVDQAYQDAETALTD